LFAAAMGAVIWNKYQQMAQGIMFVMAGGMLALQGGKVLLDSFAGEHAKEQIDSGVAKTDSMIDQKLGVPDAASGQSATQQLSSLAQQPAATAPAVSPGPTVPPATS
jgi:hypothetical protein